MDASIKLLSTVWVLAMLAENTRSKTMSVTGMSMVSGTRFHMRLIKDLLRDYNPMVRPVEDTSSTVTVSIRVTLHQIRELDEKNQHLTTNVWLRFFWKDEFLSWNASEYNGIQRLHILSSKIWRPDIVLYNSVDEERTAADLLSDTNVELTPDGTVSWTTPAMFKSACKIEIDSYPFDVQKCPLKFGSWTYNGYEVNVTTFAPYIMMDNLMANGEWEMVSAPCVRNEVYYSCCPQPYPDVTCKLLMRRRPLFYIYNLVVPCLLLIFIGSLVFILPPESGEKVSLAMTVLLAMTVFMLVVMENIPPTSEVVPLLEQFIGATIVLLTLSTMIAIFIVNFHFKGQSVRRPSRFLRNLVLNWLARLVFMKKHILWDNSDFFKKDDTNTDNSEQASHVTFGSRHHDGHLGENGCVHLLGCNGHCSTEGRSDMSPQEMDELLPKSSAQASRERYPTPETAEYLVRIYARLDQVCRTLASSQDHKYNEEKAKREWRSIAMVLDRCFFFIFLVLILLTCISLFAQIPSYSKSDG